MLCHHTYVIIWDFFHENDRKQLMFVFIIILTLSWKYCAQPCYCKIILKKLIVITCSIIKLLFGCAHTFLHSKFDTKQRNFTIWLGLFLFSEYHYEVLQISINLWIVKYYLQYQVKYIYWLELSPLYCNKISNVIQ